MGWQLYCQPRRVRQYNCRPNDDPLGPKTAVGWVSCLLSAEEKPGPRSQPTNLDVSDRPYCTAPGGRPYSAFRIRPRHVKEPGKTRAKPDYPPSSGTRVLERASGEKVSMAAWAFGLWLSVLAAAFGRETPRSKT